MYAVITGITVPIVLLRTEINIYIKQVFKTLTRKRLTKNVTMSIEIKWP